MDHYSGYSNSGPSIVGENEEVCALKWLYIIMSLKMDYLLFTFVQPGTHCCLVMIFLCASPLPSSPASITTVVLGRVTRQGQKLIVASSRNVPFGD